MRKGYILLGFFISVLLVTSVIADNIKYSRYTNVRFTYGISYPEGILIPQREAENGDGQKFISKDRQVVMLVYGYNNIADSTIDSVFKEESRKAAQQNTKREVTYKVKKNNWNVISGTDGENIFYKKVMYNVKDNQFINFEISYPKSKRAQYDSITAEIAKSMKLLSEE